MNENKRLGKGVWYLFIVYLLEGLFQGCTAISVALFLMPTPICMMNSEVYNPEYLWTWVQPIWVLIWILSRFQVKLQAGASSVG